MLQFMVSKRVRHDSVIELNWTMVYGGHLSHENFIFKKKNGQTVFLAFAVFQVPITQSDPYAKVAYFGVVYLATIHKVILHFWYNIFFISTLNFFFFLRFYFIYLLWEPGRTARGKSHSRAELLLRDGLPPPFYTFLVLNIWCQSPAPVSV